MKTADFGEARELAVHADACSDAGPDPIAHPGRSLGHEIRIGDVRTSHRDEIAGARLQDRLGGCGRDDAADTDDRDLDVDELAELDDEGDIRRLVVAIARNGARVALSPVAHGRVQQIDLAGTKDPLKVGRDADGATALVLGRPQVVGGCAVSNDAI